ncbi:hypothetical protein EIP91_006663 [Steccherinum ochraceum]|uniref:Intradiol ring-cleavage dioxygenases domain-containing protein n=1 Tax=Steccherinum ochraceum TaxID=92696 RepID=A0A4R0RDP4_9APHY|nr:hypothetical protein EIP91_006663 [Steccherinum ochraceum]
MEPAQRVSFGLRRFAHNDSNGEVVPSLTRISSAVYGFIVLLTQEFPFLWSHFLQGSKNDRADMMGPYYVLGAPSRQVEDGKAVLATAGELKQFAPYLMTVTVKTPKGEPVPYATFDWWQADTSGTYSNNTYRFRGKFKANADGVAEVLTVAPGEYGPKGYARAGHFHVIIGPGDAKPELVHLTTQIYVCENNDASAMNTDILNLVRAVRKQNMNQSWSIPEANGLQQYMGFPKLDSEDADTLKRVEWWNSKLEEIELKVVAGAETEIVLNSR